MTQNVQSQARRVLSKFGGSLSAMAEATGLSRRVVEHALATGFIHPKLYPDLLQRAHLAGLDLTPFDFIAHLVAVRPAELAARAAE